MTATIGIISKEALPESQSEFGDNGTSLAKPEEMDTIEWPSAPVIYIFIDKVTDNVVEDVQSRRGIRMREKYA